MSEEKNLFGDYLRELRIREGYKTQKNLAEVSGVSQTTLSRIEAGTQKPQPDTLKVLAQHLNTVTYEELMNKAGYFNEQTNLSPREERDIAADLERMINDLESNDALAFHGEPMDEETKELMRISLENSLRLAKGMAKKKFNPNKNK